jgi:hypothetical protein
MAHKIKKNHKLSKDKLRKLYSDEKLSIKEISKKFNCSYFKIWKVMKRFGIKSRSLSEANTLNNLKRKIVIPKEKLEELYINRKISSLGIANMYNCHHSVILNRLNENNIKTRDSVEANTKYPKKDFDGTEEEKAYMLGFALGDLNVRKINKDGRTIVIQGNSTINNQISLIKFLFENYGPIKINNINQGFAKKEKRIIVYLNESFNFLLYKMDRIPEWALSNENVFFAFFAGYIDAEGHIRTKMPTWLSISSYDKGILNQLHKNLIKNGITCPGIKISAKKGYSTLTKPSPYKKDMWCLGVYSKKSLLQLFVKIMPYLKHKNRVMAMRNSIKQIGCRNKRYDYQKMRGD